jgi:hypothetical protein
MVQYLTSLQDRRVVFTGYLVVDGQRITRPEAIRLARRHGARVSSDERARVTRSVDVLIRGSNVQHAHGDWGEDEEAAAQLQRNGHQIAVIDGDGFGALLDGGWAPILPARSVAPDLPWGCRDYRPANTLVTSLAAEPTARDLTEALRQHHLLQQRIAEAALKAEYRVISSSRHEAAFDVGWIDRGGRLNIVEVKSLERHDQAPQLRLGLGQILDYRERLHPDGAYLAVTQRPNEDRHWRQVCDSAGIKLLAPSDVSSIFD